MHLRSAYARRTGRVFNFVFNVFVFNFVFGFLGRAAFRAGAGHVILSKWIFALFLGNCECVENATRCMSIPVGIHGLRHGIVGFSLAE